MYKWRPIAKAKWCNQQRHKYRRILSKLRLKIFVYEDKGMLPKLYKLIRKVEKRSQVR